MNLSIYVTDRCNMNCEYCFNSESHSKTHEITFVGGEPLLNEKLIKQIVSYTSNCDDSFSFSLLTNGTLLSKEFIQYSIKNKITISISIDGNKESHNALRKSNNSYEKFNLKLLMLIKHLPDTMVFYTLNPKTIKYFAKSMNHLLKQNVRYISISFNYNSKWKTNDLEILKKELSKISGMYIGSFQKNEYFYLNLFENKILLMVNERIEKGRCDMVFAKK